MALTAGRIAQIKSMYTTYQNNKIVGYSQDDFDYGPFAIDNSWIYVGQGAIQFYDSAKFRNTNGNGSNIGLAGTMGFTNLSPGNFGAAAISSIYLEKKIIALGITYDNYAYFDMNQPIETLKSMPFTGIKGYKSMLPGGIIADSSNMFIIQGLQEGFWVLTKVSGGLNGVDNFPGYGRGFTPTQNFAGATMRLVKLKYTDLSVIRTVDFTMPMDLVTAGWGGGEDCSIGGWEGEDYIIFQSGTEMFLVDISGGSQGSIVDKWPMVNMGNALNNTVHQPIALDYENKWVFRDRGDDTFGDPFGLSQLHTLVLDPNRPPNKPSSLIPSSTDPNKATIVNTLVPSLSWAFTDLDNADFQTAYEVEVVNGANFSDIKWNTGKVKVGSTYAKVPEGILQPDGFYAWRVRVWDKYDAVSEWSNAGGTVGGTDYWRFFRLTKAPTVTLINPGTEEEPTGTGLFPRLEWNYSDPEDNEQSAFSLQIYEEDGTFILDTGIISSANKYFDVPEVLEEARAYQWQVRVYDTTQMSTLSSKGWFFTNNPPAKMKVLGPVDGYRTTIEPYFEFTIPDDIEDDDMSFEIQWAEDIDFTVNVESSKSKDFLNYWFVCKPDGKYTSIGDGTVDSTYEGGRVKCTKSDPFKLDKTYYYRARAIDEFTNTGGQWSKPRSIRVGNILQVSMKKPVITASVHAEKILFKLFYTMAQDGVDPATIKIEVTNNALDSNPTWEDMTENYFNSKEGYYVFKNKEKTASDFAVNFRITITANDTLGDLSIKGIGMSFD